MANPFSPAQIDFSQLANLPAQYRQGQQWRREDDLRDAFSEGLPKGPNGEIDWSSAYDTMAQHDPMAAMKAASGYGQGGASVYGTPIYGEGGRVGVIPKQGGGVQWLDTDGVGVQPGVQYLNTGTGFVPADKRSGRTVGPAIPIDNAGAAADTAEGKSQGENVALLRSMEAKLPGLYQTVTKLEDLSDKATYTTAGQAYDYVRKEAGFEPTEGAIARTEYMATVDNQVLPLLRDTFGAAFTVEEGKSLRATLGDADKSPQEKQAVLRAFIDQKVRDLKALSTQTGVSVNMPSAGPKPGEVVSGYRFKGGNPNDPNAWEQSQ